MASDLDFVQYVVEQISDQCGISFKKMFGEYALYSHEKVVALICDNQLFVKSTQAGKQYIGDFVEAPAYPGAKPSLLIDGQIDDSEWLSALIIITEKALPIPKTKHKKLKNNVQDIYKSN
ncbi:TfoX/Sxy family protein [Celerinatantimonas yamalensis]|uniref:TfoX/Sxy family protein n=1 Tax=Celerinatantimonas yamalensis TaxID=559956 RepID=A0ABW9G7N6_9GAMM